MGTGAGTVKPQAATAIALDGDERDRFWERQCSLDPAFRAYEERTTRTIPRRRPAAAGPGRSTGACPGDG
jgi:hypothetical protein